MVQVVFNFKMKGCQLLKYLSDIVFFKVSFLPPPSLILLSLRYLSFPDFAPFLRSRPPSPIASFSYPLFSCMLACPSNLFL